MPVFKYNFGSFWTLLSGFKPYFSRPNLSCFPPINLRIRIWSILSCFPRLPTYTYTVNFILFFPTYLRIRIRVNFGSFWTLLSGFKPYFSRPNLSCFPPINLRIRIRSILSCFPRLPTYTYTVNFVLFSPLTYVYV